MRVNIIGLGGVGSYLSEFLMRYLAYQEENYEVTFVDGDQYELKNKSRQIFIQGGGNKAENQRRKFSDLFQNNIRFKSVNTYVNKDNISEIILDNDVTFICVDNHKSRKIINDHINKLQNAVVISGGNEYTDGNCQLYVRRDGINVTPSLTDYHPEILNPNDHSPEDMSCEELAKSSPQLIFSNITVATFMCWLYYNYLENNIKNSEVYFDGLTMNSLAKSRRPKN